jgi:transcriptional regulator of arginine metabolism
MLFHTRPRRSNVFLRHSYSCHENSNAKIIFEKVSPMVNNNKKSNTAKTVARRTKIKELIAKNPNFATQEDIATELETFGIEASQPTISRDIKILKLEKDLATKGYRLNLSDENAKKMNLFREAVALSGLKLLSAPNMFVIRTNRGQARGVAALIEETFPEEVLGTIAGDDCAILITSDEESGQVFFANFPTYPEPTNTKDISD